ncbi:MAG: homocysteine S-methyltransferase, partial [Candidatus Nanopelagicales bacterium]|nr:homocysteine S-methyltransferase [Candidatus Nanopelagicales bacterium]
MILDGGMGHLLRRNGVDISGPIGTMERFRGVARANRDSPDIVLQSHLQFLRSGADVITTNTYACVPAALATESGGSPDDVVDLVQAGGALAARARDIAISEGLSNTRPLVAGCLPPLHESYRPDRVGDYDELSSTYRMIVDSVAPSSDVLLCETMHSTAEACAAAEAANAAGLPVWVSFTVSEVDVGCLRSGEAIAEGVAAIAEFRNVEAAMLNCSSPEAITSALPLLVQAA